MRGRLYSSCASSTWSLPSALRACWAKMSRISCVRSTTRVWSSFSSVAAAPGRARRPRSALRARRRRMRRFSSSSFPLPTYVRGSGRARCWTSSPPARRPRCGRARELGELVLGVDPRGQHGEDESALGLGPGGVRLAMGHAPICTRTSRPMPPDLAARTLELVDIPSESRQRRRSSTTSGRAVPAEPRLRRRRAVCSTPAPGTLVLLAGHSTPCPRRPTCPGRLEDGWVLGLGASDMKGGLAVMIELARAGAPTRSTRTSSSGARSSGRRRARCRPSSSGAVEDDARSSSCLEPTDNTVQAGCLGNLNARLRFRGAARIRPGRGRARTRSRRAVDGLAPVVALQPPTSRSRASSSSRSRR